MSTLEQLVARYQAADAIDSRRDAEWLRAADNRRDAEWLREQIMALANYSILIRPVTPEGMRRAMIAIHGGRPWRGVLR